MTGAAASRRGPIDGATSPPAGGGPTASVGIEEFVELGIRALVTTRAAGSFSIHSQEAMHMVMGRWRALQTELGTDAPGGRLASVGQVHGNRVVAHVPGWEGWLRIEGADGHFVADPGTGLAITVADCVPVFLVHPSRAVALVHAGWRGVAAAILPRALDLFAQRGWRAADVRVHLGPAICGRCYEVGPDVYAQLTARHAELPTTVDLRGLLADQARSAGVRAISESPWCTRCHTELFFSHRGGDTGRQVAALIAPDTP